MWYNFVHAKKRNLYFSSIAKNASISKEKGKVPAFLSQTIYISILCLFLSPRLVKPLHLKILNRRIARMQLWWPIKTYRMACCVGGI
jgi:hypothetical protein